MRVFVLFILQIGWLASKRANLLYKEGRIQALRRVVPLVCLGCIVTCHSRDALLAPTPPGLTEELTFRLSDKPRSPGVRDNLVSELGLGLGLVLEVRTLRDVTNELCQVETLRVLL